MKKILVIDDDPSLARTLELYFKGKGYRVEVANAGINGLKLWHTAEPDMVLMDVQLPDLDGPEVLAKAKEERLGGDVIMITAFHDTDATLKAIRLGAADYLYKPIDLDALDLLLEKILVQRQQQERMTRLCHVISESYKPDQLIGRSARMLAVIKAIAQVASSRTNVLIEGETGTGKELVARTIHHASCPEEPFIAINCAAIVGTLLESELFGHEKGAFTGAVHRKIGKLEYAGHGTVFLDEIGELPLEFQAKLLRVLQEREIQRVGGVQTVPLQARVVAATNRDLNEMVQHKTFREDLYFRLQVFSIQIPPLRERKEDIVPLTEYFLHRLNQEMHKHVRRIPNAYLSEFQAYDWPGNIRELQNVLHRGLIISTSDTLELDENWRIDKHAVPKKDGLRQDGADVLISLEALERTHIDKVLRFTRWNFGEACAILGISRPTLRKKIHDYRLEEGD
ncbi:MAG: sigma-54 dependent transcriptional regulator [Desulfobulbus sp.]|jgi:two-component system response regulator AtoC|uniref:sigma-54-dependent transcriptional regulator n=1 Tax=Desulfobulbus sp. TaxID=895 RepID=UPI00284064F3|nr:sigma-54 dependent transcriptional regulator [Desulfobulbus sp.]MDR2549904.1 sigma-54 dependent transcriptional regulator [Desulfobulbus sp.]